jgi:hypothetical protein
MRMNVHQTRTKNKFVTRIKGFHAVYPSTAMFERHTSICNGHVVSAEQINWSSLFPNNGGYEDADWEVTVVRIPKKKNRR